ncbi:Qat anti-phage system QueC-like protein QatC [Qipengyuania sediminis]|uniref:Qat anti-phage system QueC-like protein QatC n=1 Tax=Qipengyuania sediminis TaxID=1532023 RepID=UPI00105A5CD2|nr:Qat anti-phage system QueC-like protein QatC [Qipengyuania sediminis]
MISVACLPADLGDIPGTDVRFDLYSHSRIGDRGRVGNRVPGPLQKLGLRPPAIAWDFTTFALAAVAADETAPRDRSPDGWTREIALTIAVTDPDLWNGQAAVLTTALRFLSGDIWHINFVGHGIAPTGRGRERLRPENLVCLLSGGMDSLVGAIDVVREGHQPLLVSQIAKGDSADQRWFAQTIAPSSLHLQLNHHARPPGRSERSQRARSLAFLGFGVLAASCTTAYRDGIEVELRIPENGFISQNVPLTPMRTGSLSTKTTHPYFLALMQDALRSAGLHVRLNNPYAVATKGEMLSACQDQQMLAKLASASTSCGRFSRTGFQHCGRCVPCQVRRGAYMAWGRADDTVKGYKYDDLGIGDARHGRFDDVRSVALAIENVRRNGLAELIGGSINTQLLGNAAPYKDVVRRGISELAALHAAYGVP